MRVCAHILLHTFLCLPFFNALQRSIIRFFVVAANKENVWGHTQQLTKSSLTNTSLRFNTHIHTSPTTTSRNHPPILWMPTAICEARMHLQTDASACVMLCYVCVVATCSRYRCSAFEWHSACLHAVVCIRVDAGLHFLHFIFISVLFAENKIKMFHTNVFVHVRVCVAHLLPFWWFCGRYGFPAQTLLFFSSLKYCRIFGVCYILLLFVWFEFDACAFRSSMTCEMLRNMFRQQNK